MNRPTFLSLFSGIGGLDLGLERAGWECVGQVENDPYCQRVLAKHWPNVARWGDIKELTPDDLPRADLICGGFPCQPVSSAGRRRGQSDERWLWPEFARAVRHLRPGWVLVENVPGLLVRGMGDVLGDLAEVGYDAEWLCLSAADVGAPHLRERVWVIAWPQQRRPLADVGSGRRPGDELRPRRHVAGLRREAVADPAVARRPAGAPGASRSARDETRRPGSGGLGGEVADSDSQAGRVTTPIFAGARLAPLPRPGQAGPGRCDGVDDPWAVEPDVGRSLAGFPHWLDRSGALNESIMVLWAYADARQTSPGEVLRAVRETAPAQEVQRAAGGLRGVPSQEVLRSHLRVLEQRTRDQRCLPLAVTEAPGAEVRGVRGEPPAPRPPRQRGHHPDDVGERPDALQQLSQLLARCAGAAWAAYQRTDAGPVLNAWQDGWENGIPRTALGVPARLDRLRALGNAVVPQVAELIGRRILEADTA